MKLTVGSLVITLAVGVVLGAMGSHRLMAQQESVRRTGSSDDRLGRDCGIRTADGAG